MYNYMASSIKTDDEKKDKVRIFTNENKPKLLLYIILALVIFQTFVIIFLAHNVLIVIPHNNNITKYDLNRKIDLIDSDLEGKLNELSKNIMETSKSLAETKTDLSGQIDTIKAKTSSDFSGIIQNAVKSVVSIRTDVAQGTGFIITSNGYVVTNAHVLSGATYAEAITSDQEVKPMELIGYNLTMDIALLKLKGEYNYLDFKDSDSVHVGEKVIAIGNPLGLSFSVSEGIISALNREGSNGLNIYIQTDASLNPGNSGGPLIGTDGKVVGINNFKARAESIGFALESNYIRNTVNEISLNRVNATILN